jgi:hypothetical protein
MKKKLLHLFIVLHSLFVFILALPSKAVADALQDALDTAETTNIKAQLPKNDNPAFIIGDIIKYTLGFLGTVFLVLIIYGGFLWMTAGGNEQQIEKAKKILSNSVIGLLVVILAYGLSIFIINVIISATTTSK